MRDYGCLVVFLAILSLSLSTSAESAPDTLDPKGSDPHTAASGTLKGPIKNNCRVDPGDVVVYLDGVKTSTDYPVIRVKQKGRRFLPNFIVLPTGGKIQFSNDESRDITHNVFSRSPLWSAELGTFHPEEKKVYTFPKPGKIRVLCSIHRDMRLFVFVTPNIHFSHVKQNKYEIKGIPSGEYTVKVRCLRSRVYSPSQKVTIHAGKETTLPINLKCRGRGRGR